MSLPADGALIEGAQQEYATFGLLEPECRFEIADLTNGPVALNDPSQNLISAFWECYQLGSGNPQEPPEDTSIFISKFNGTDWEESTVVFDPLEVATTLTVTFDQLGRAVVFYNNGTELKLYWFNPVTSENEIRNFGEGAFPIARFDYPERTSYSGSDILAYYVRNNNVYYRQQRDRFDIEYDTGIAGLNLQMESAGLTVGRTQQIVITRLGGG